MRICLLVLVACSPRQVRAPEPVPDSPGIVWVSGGSRTFERSLEQYRGGHWQAALVELEKVVQADSGDHPDVRRVALYDMATICIEQGLYTNAFNFYDSLADGGAPDELRRLGAEGVAVIDERLRGTTTLAIDDVLVKLGAPARGQRPAITARLVADWSRWTYEHDRLAKSPAWWLSSPVSYHLAEDLAYYWKTLVVSCAQHEVECVAAARWIPRPTPRPIGIRTMTMAATPADPPQWHAP